MVARAHIIQNKMLTKRLTDILVYLNLSNKYQVASQQVKTYKIILFAFQICQFY